MLGSRWSLRINSVPFQGSTLYCRGDRLTISWFWKIRGQKGEGIYQDISLSLLSQALLWQWLHFLVGPAPTREATTWPPALGFNNTASLLLSLQATSSGSSAITDAWVASLSQLGTQFFYHLVTTPGITFCLLQILEVAAIFLVIPDC